MHQSNAHLTSGRLLASNTIWNLLGQILPMVVGLVAIPILIREIGVARFGVLSLASVLIGYFSLFDLGISRALTKLVAEKLGTDEEHTLPPLASASLLLMLLLGVCAGLLTWALAPWLIHRALKVPPALQPEALRSFYLLALSLPLVTVTSGLRGILEAQQRFRILNMIRIPMGVFSFAGPLLVLPFSQGLVPIIIALIVGRLLGSLAHLFACMHSMPGLIRGFSFNYSVFLPLLKFGSWITVSNVIGPFLIYGDRFLIGALLSVGAVAYYSAPFDIIIRLTVIPTSVAGVLFPAFATSFVHDPKRATLLLHRSLKYISFVAFPIVLTIVSLAPEGLRLWLGADFSQHSAPVLRWLAAGVFVNSLSTVAFVLIQSAGRPDLAARIHILETPPNIVLAWVLTRHLGIEGTAIAWTVRMSVDALLLFLLSRRVLPETSSLLKRVGIGVTAGILVLYASTLPTSLVLRVALLLAELFVFAFFGWFRFFGPEERRSLLGMLGLRTRVDLVEQIQKPATSQGLLRSSPGKENI